MAFKLIREWLFAGLRRHRAKHGQLVVTSEGEAIISVRFTPTKTVVEFTDSEPPIDPCHPHAHDTLDFDQVWLGHGRWGIKIKWSVFAARHIKYRIDGVA